MEQQTKTRVMYPNRTVYFGIQTGLIDAEDWDAIDTVGGVRLDRMLAGFYSWNVQDLEKVSRQNGMLRK
jgi:hypothetical protein